MKISLAHTIDANIRNQQESKDKVIAELLAENMLKDERIAELLAENMLKDERIAELNGGIVSIMGILDILGNMLNSEKLEND